MRGIRRQAQTTRQMTRPFVPLTLCAFLYLIITAVQLTRTVSRRKRAPNPIKPMKADHSIDFTELPIADPRIHPSNGHGYG